MSLLWLLAWLLFATPEIQLVSGWNEWGMTLVAALAVDVIGSLVWLGRGNRPYLHAFGRTYTLRGGLASNR